MARSRSRPSIRKFFTSGLEREHHGVTTRFYIRDVSSTKLVEFSLVNKL